MASKRLRVTSVIVALLLGLSLLALGAREILIPGGMAREVQALRPVTGGDYSPVARTGYFILGWGLLLLMFCWYLRMRGFWFALSLCVLLFGAIVTLSPQQGLQTFKRLYMGPSYYPVIAAAAEAALGVMLLASIRLKE